MHVYITDIIYKKIDTTISTIIVAHNKRELKDCVAAYNRARGINEQEYEILKIKREDFAIFLEREIK